MSNEITNGNSVISLKGVNKWYGDFQALKDINLEIKAKEKIVICGPSGSDIELRLIYLNPMVHK